MSQKILHSKYFAVKTLSTGGSREYEAERKIKHGPVMLTDIVSTAGGFKNISGKGGGVEYFILNFYLPRGQVKSNVQSIGNIINFRIYRRYLLL